MSRLNMRVLAGILVFALVFLQYRLWLQPGGLRDMWRLKKQLAQQALENDKMKKMNDQLMQQIRHSQKSNEAAELRARNELGMIKKGETFYQVVRQ